MSKEQLFECYWHGEIEAFGQETCEIAEICSFLGLHAVQSGNSLTDFFENTYRFLGFLEIL
jgi:hypothetical protein